MKQNNDSSPVIKTICICLTLALCAGIAAAGISVIGKKAVTTNNDVAGIYAGTASPASGSGEDAGILTDDTALPGEEKQEPGGNAQPGESETPSSDGGDTGGDELTVEPQAPASDSSTPAAAKTAAAPRSSASAAKSSIPSSKKEILDYLNASLNKVKPSAKSVTQTIEKNYQPSSIDLGSIGFMEGAVNSLIKSNMGINKNKTNITVTSAAEKNRIFPVENESWASRLTLSDIKDISLKQSGSNYVITAKVLDDDLAESVKHGTGHHAKAFSIVQPETVRSNAGAAGGLLKGLKIGYKNGVITAVIDSKTGNVTHAEYDFVWILHVDTAGGINAPFGIIQKFDVKW